MLAQSHPSGAAQASPTQTPDEKPVWVPLPGSQTLCLSCPANIIVYHGTRGPGKTDAQLMRFRRRVGLGYGSFWRGVIFDREYKNLDDLVAKSQRWFPAFNDGARWLKSTADYKWVWPTGEELLFRSIKRDEDYWAYHGQEYPFIGWNELTKYPTESLFESMMSCNRTSFRPEDYPQLNGETGEEYLLDDLPLEVNATTNPFGVGHNWVKKRFISISKPGEIVKMTTRVFNPRTQKDEDVVKTQCHIFGSYRENKYLPPEYIAELHKTSDPNKRKAWLTGSWDIVSGGMFDGDWDRKVHVLPPFDIPKTWILRRSFDWGSSAPFSVGWWAISDGSDVKLPDGRIRPTVRGDMFRIHEWYGSSGETNTGLRMLATDITAGIIQIELEQGLYGKVRPGPADSSIFDVEDGNSIAQSMAKSVKVNGSTYKGIQWKRADKGPGSRIAGWEKIRRMLQNAVKPEGGAREYPGLFVFDTCKSFIELFPILPRDEKKPDDVDTDAEDHIADEARYMVLDSGRGVGSGRTVGLGG